MSDTRSKIESLLFISPKSLSAGKLAKILNKDAKEVKGVLDELASAWNAKAGGVHIIKNGDEYQMATSPENAKLVQEFVKDETTGELTRPALEALTIIAYRAPVTKAELEQIRGVNCSLILRNLLIRGLVESYEDAATKLTYFRPTFDFLRHLGIGGVDALPEFEALNSDEHLQQLLNGGGRSEVATTEEGEQTA